MDQGKANAKLMALLCLLVVVGPTAAFLYLPALPQVAQAFATTEAGVQTTLTAYMIGSCLGYAVLGGLSDRFGARKVLLISMAGFVMIGLFAIFATSLQVLIGLRTLQGLTSAGGILVARTVVRRHFTKNAAQAMSTLSACSGFAPAISPLVGALVLLIGDWRVTFLMTALIGAIALILSWALLPAEPPQTQADLARKDRLRDILRHPEVRVGLTAAVLQNGAFIVMMAGSPFIFIEGFGWTKLSYSILFALILSGFAVVSLLSGQWVSKRGLKAVITAILPWVGGGAALQLGGAILGSDYMIGFGLTIMIAAMGPMVPGNHLRVLEPFPAMVGTVTGLSMLVITASSVAMIALYGGTASGSLIGYGLWIFCLTWGAIALWALRPPPTGFKQSQPD